ncbi:RidA family protein [Halomonas sp.]|uniref:RidA family protein n=1 Tax=Halomonas sp. TaxID=1486246 RepID=UPI003A92E40B
MTKPLEFQNPDALFDPTPYGYCHTVKAPPGGQLVYISGQFGGEGAANTLSDDFRHQTQATLNNLGRALKAHGLDYTNIMKITVLIVDHSAEKLAVWGEEMRHCWPMDKLPASTLIPVPQLALETMQIEVDAVAWKAADV